VAKIAQPSITVPPATRRVASPAPVKPRLKGIDGLRAFAALWVVLFHIRAFSGAHLGIVPGLDLLVRSGSTGVSLFLVLSGFCLYLPFAGGRLDRFRVATFFARRCRRLLPAYYATLVLLLAAYAVAAGHWGLDPMSAAGLAGQAATHVGLMHQLFPSTFYGLNGAYWSLGLEWELYLTLPLIIMAVRRIGLARTVGAVVVLNVAYRLALWVAVTQGLMAAGTPLATVVLPNLFLGRWAEFALGMVAAELYMRGLSGSWGRRLVVPGLLAVPLSFAVSGNPLVHLLFGVIFFMVVCLVAADDNLVARAFSWSPLVVVGVMSYSLYLVHQPLIQIGAHLLGKGGRVAPNQVFAELLLALPVVLAAAWFVFVAVERRSVSVASMEGVPGSSLLFPRWLSARRSVGQ
jgi:peptidoglycan/LPS O-acetylase OafA/YrhL